MAQGLKPDSHAAGVSVIVGGGARTERDLDKSGCEYRFGWAKIGRCSDGPFVVGESYSGLA